jgi:hypothetical protein
MRTIYRFRSGRYFREEDSNHHQPYYAVFGGFLEEAKRK